MKLKLLDSYRANSSDQATYLLASVQGDSEAVCGYTALLYRLDDSFNGKARKGKWLTDYIYKYIPIGE